MKKIIFTLLSSASILYGAAQTCNFNGPEACNPTRTLQTSGFENLNNVPCAERGVYYEASIQFKMFTTFDFAGHQNVDSIEFNTIGNLPCGLCWATDQADKRYTASEYGCIRISGKTNDSIGQYKLALSLKAWINGIATAQSVPALLVDQTGIRLHARVKENAGAQCVTLDTATNSPANKTAGTGCVTGIDEITTAAVSNLQIAPNRFGDRATVSFNAEKAGVYTISIIDMAGRALNVKQLDVTPGNNITTVERGNLPAGIYFLSVSNGQMAATSKFTITE